MKLYEVIYKLLKEHTELRDSDKKLQWRIMELTGAIRNGVLTYESWMNAENTETIRRTRQKVQEDHEELKSSPQVQAYKDAKESTQGKFVYREPVQVDWEKMRQEAIAKQNSQEDINSLFSGV